MKAELTSENSVRKAIDFDIDKDVVSKEIDKRAKNIATRAQIPGFRPGKVPLTVVKRQFKADVEQEAVEAIANQVLPKELEAHGLKPVAPPKLEKVDLSPDQSLKFRITFDILPEVAIPAFRGIEVSVKRQTPTQEMLDIEMTGSGTPRPALNPRPIARLGRAISSRWTSRSPTTRPARRESVRRPSSRSATPPTTTS